MRSDLTTDEIADIHEAMCQDGAIEFFQKAKAICENMDACTKCPLGEFCMEEMNRLEDEADFVRKVMEYKTYQGILTIII